MKQKPYVLHKVLHGPTILVEGLGAIQAVWQFLSAHGSIDIQVTGTACIKVGPISPCLPFKVTKTVEAPTPTPPTLTPPSHSPSPKLE
jgi:hypothetical protein